MNTKLFSLMLILFLSIGVASFAQGRGQGRGPVGGPPAGVGNAGIEHGTGDHGQLTGSPSRQGGNLLWLNEYPDRFKDRSGYVY